MGVYLRARINAKCWPDMCGEGGAQLDDEWITPRSARRSADKSLRTRPTSASHPPIPQSPLVSLAHSNYFLFLHSHPPCTQPDHRHNLLRHLSKLVSGSIYGIPFPRFTFFPIRSSPFHCYPCPHRTLITLLPFNPRLPPTSTNSAWFKREKIFQGSLICPFWISHLHSVPFHRSYRSVASLASGVLADTVPCNRPTWTHLDQAQTCQNGSM
jgi:hypothetical protein